MLCSTIVANVLLFSVWRLSHPPIDVDLYSLQANEAMHNAFKAGLLMTLPSLY